MLTNIGVALVGAGTCGWFFNLLSRSGTAGFDWWSVLGATFGAMAFLLVWHQMSGWPATVNGAHDGAR
jgi:uncharacterized membrane protein YeaQ/YmgE (transglycosylase-associated protein family)